LIYRKSIEYSIEKSPFAGFEFNFISLWKSLVRLQVVAITREISCLLVGLLLKTYSWTLLQPLQPLHIFLLEYLINL